jgi:hypothetical protein
MWEWFFYPQPKFKLFQNNLGWRSPLLEPNVVKKYTKKPMLIESNIGFFI